MFQAHSATSKAASHIDRRKLRQKVLDLIKLSGIHGMTGHEIADQLNIGPNSASGRLRELRLDNHIRKSPEKRGYSIRPGVIVESHIWKLPEFVTVEADIKRDKAKEALALVMQMKKENPSLEALTIINRLKDILK